MRIGSILGVLLLLSVVAACTTQTSPGAAANTTENTTVTQPVGQTPIVGGTENVPAEQKANAVEVTMHAGNFYLNPASIAAKKGDTVTIHFIVDDGTHGLGIEGYNVQTDALEAGDTKDITFVADKAGTFRFYCDVYCGEGHRDMKGTLTVTE